MCEHGLGLSQLYRALRGTLLHPQWLSDRFHDRSRRFHLKALTNCRVLDIGSGNAQPDQFLGAGCSVCRLDYPETNRRYHSVPDVFGDARRLPFAAGAFDAVMILEVLEHVPEEHEAMREANRVLRPGGRLFLSVPFVYPLHDRPHDYRRFTIYGLRLLLRKHGFVPEIEVRHGNSFLAALQLANLAMLEVVQAALRRGLLLGALGGVLAYPVCLLNNILAVPLLRLSGSDASCFGYFVIAVRSA
jgi:SAM-dependent methyltransferase